MSTFTAAELRKRPAVWRTTIPMRTKSEANQRERWRSDQVQAVRDYYANTPPKEFSLDRLAVVVGKSRFSVAIKASRMGLGSYSRPKLAKPKATQLELPWGRWIKFEHPRGMRGKKHTPEALARVSEASRRSWAKAKATGTGHMSPEQLQRRSDLMLRRNLTDPRLTPRYSRSKGGRRPDLSNRYFRSSWEANIARYLNFLQAHGQIHRWNFECETFEFKGIKRGTRSYTPDFKIWDTADSVPYFWEVKGWMDDKSKTRLRRMKKYHPQVRIEVIDEKRYRGIAATAGGLIPTWERRGGKGEYAVEIEIAPANLTPRTPLVLPSGEMA